MGPVGDYFVPSEKCAGHWQVYPDYSQEFSYIVHDGISCPRREIKRHRVLSFKLSAETQCVHLLVFKVSIAGSLSLELIRTEISVPISVPIRGKRKGFPPIQQSGIVTTALPETDLGSTYRRQSSTEPSRHRYEQGHGRNCGQVVEQNTLTTKTLISKSLHIDKRVTTVEDCCVKRKARIAKSSTVYVLTWT